MHEDEVKKCRREEDGVFVTGVGTHSGEDQPEQCAACDDTRDQERFAMAGVEAVSFAQRSGRVGARSIEDAIGDIDEPGSDGEQQRGVPGKLDVHGAGEEP